MSVHNVNHLGPGVAVIYCEYLQGHVNYENAYQSTNPVVHHNGHNLIYMY